MPISQRLRLSLRGPESTIAAIGWTTLVCWLSSLAYQWIQHLFAGHIPTLWHPAGVGVALVLLWGYRVWPGIALAAFLSVAPLGTPTTGFVVLAVIGALIDTVGTAFLTRLLSGKQFQPSLVRTRDVAALVSALFISTAFRAGIGVAVYVVEAWGSLDNLWLRWITLWHGGVLGIILFAPMILVWTQPRRRRAGHILEALALTVGMVIIGVGAFAHLPPELALSMVYLVFPVMAWSALRFQQQGAVTAGTIAVSIVLLSAYGGHSPILGDASFAPFVLWLPVEISAVSALFISATVSERELAFHNARQLVAVMEATPDLVAIADGERKITFMNRAGRQILGFGEKEDLRSLTIADLHPPEEIEKLDKVALPEATMFGTWRGETLLRTSAGRAIPFSQVIVTRRNRAGEVTHFATIGRDIAKQKEQEIQLRQAQKMDAIGRLAAGVAHDFNNLLTIIRGNCELALPLTEPGDELHEALDEIEDAGKRASDLTAQLLAFSRQQVTRPQPMDLNRVVGNILGMLGRLLGENIVLDFQPAESLAFVQADSGMMDQVILNLAINARDAMPDGGVLTIQTEHVEISGTVDKTGFQVPPGKYVTLGITDTGIGIRDETLAHLFEPFFTTKVVGKGTGLGLATVYGIVKQNGGFITVDSQVGCGSTFRVYLPPVEKGEPEHMEPAPVLSNEVPHGSILLVEDEDHLRELLRRHLSASGYCVVTARDGNEGLAVCRDRGYVPELLVTDLIMPGMGGRELAERIRADHPEVKVLFITGYTDEKALREGALPRGMACLNKPFELRVLAAKVRETLVRA